ncbi:hypothetical protein Aduo_007456 [Ancylostoma duodenale]
MQNELLDPTISPGATPHVGQHVTVPAQPLSGPLSVAEVFLTAGHAFQKLGDLAMQLHMGPSSIPAEEYRSNLHVGPSTGLLRVSLNDSHTLRYYGFTKALYGAQL